VFRRVLLVPKFSEIAVGYTDIGYGESFHNRCQALLLAHCSRGNPGWVSSQSETTSHR
jgi:hypothetical protein